MKKFIRGLCLGITYVLALPLFIFGSLVVLGYDLYKVICKDYSFGYIKESFGAIYEGIRDGHKINWHWVKTGENYFDKIVREGQES